MREEYIALDENEFVPLNNYVCDELKGKYKINKKGETLCIQNGKINSAYSLVKRYPTRSFRCGPIKKSYSIHLLVANTFLKEVPGKNEIDHIDRNPLNYHISNLRRVSREENIANRVFSNDSNLYLVKLDEAGNEIERISYNNITKQRRNKILQSIKYNGKSEGFKWKKIDLDLETYLKKFNINLQACEFVPCSVGNISICKEGIIKRGNVYTAGWKDSFGYRKVSINGKPYFIHRLLFETFNHISLKEGQYIDHIDTDTEHNDISNLRMTTLKGNMNNPITRSKLSKPVMQYSLDGIFLREFNSLSEACASINIPRDNNCIRLCCEGKINTSHGYIWKYKNKNL